MSNARSSLNDSAIEEHCRWAGRKRVGISPDITVHSLLVEKRYYYQRPRGSPMILESSVYAFCVFASPTESLDCQWYGGRTARQTAALCRATIVRLACNISSHLSPYLSPLPQQHHPFPEQGGCPHHQRTPAAEHLYSVRSRLDKKIVKHFFTVHIHSRVYRTIYR